MPSGNLNLPQISEKGFEMELLASNYLREQGYQIIHGGAISTMKGRQSKEKYGFRKRWTKEEHKKWDYVMSLRKKLGINSSLYDYLCKKGKLYFLFEIKYKIWKEGRNHFNSSERQIREYNRAHKEGKIQVKVLTIIRKDQKLSYHIYDWDDFEKTKTTIKLKKE
ncbi:MAG: hypothetical protein IIC67_07040 [Thaumarchaeota archaeon]|nr:hypothetical protein [Nitrososphaerota archaeon]